jgi:integrase
MKRNKICILPKLYDCGGDQRKQWFIYYSYKNPANNKMVRFRIYDGFTECYTKKSKYEHGEKMVKKYADMLTAGWNPFADEPKVIYEDTLQYSAATRIFKGMRSGNKNFNYYSNLFLPEVKGMADKTYKNYISKFRVFEAWLTKKGIEGNDIKSIDQAIMKEFFLYLINDLKLARITVSKYKHMIERLFTWAIQNNHLKVSPVQNLPETTRTNDKAPRPINEADIEKLINEIKANDPQLWLSAQLEYYCFLRPGLEIRFAKIGWFDFSRSVINIPKEVIKTSENKTVIIPAQFREYLLHECKMNLFPSNYYLIGQNGIPGPAHLGSNNLRNRFNIIRDRLNLPKEYKLYSFKHTGNSRLVDSTIPMYHIQKQNGHSSMRSTEEYFKNKIGFKSDELKNSFPTL